MQRIGFMLRLKPGTEYEYQRRHDNIWPEMLDLMGEVGIRNYTIFRHDTMLFNYFECDDWQTAVEQMAASDVSARWGVYMSDILEPNVPGGQDRFPPLWASVFYFEGK